MKHTYFFLFILFIYFWSDLKSFILEMMAGNMVEPSFPLSVCALWQSFIPGDGEQPVGSVQKAVSCGRDIFMETF